MSDELIRVAADEHTNKLPEPYDALYAALGYDNFKLLFDYFGSQHVYLPSFRSVMGDAVKMKILVEHRSNDVPLAKLAKKYGYNYKYLRKVLGV